MSPPSIGSSGSLDVSGSSGKRGSDEPVFSPPKRRKPSYNQLNPLVGDIVTLIKPTRQEQRRGHYVRIPEMTPLDFVERVYQKKQVHLLEKYVGQSITTITTIDDDRLIDGDLQDPRVKKIQELFNEVYPHYEPVTNLKLVAERIYEALGCKKGTPIPDPKTLLQLGSNGGEFAYLFSGNSLTASEEVKYKQAKTIYDYLQKLQKGQSLDETPLDLNKKAQEIFQKICQLEGSARQIVMVHEIEQVANLNSPTPRTRGDRARRLQKLVKALLNQQATAGASSSSSAMIE